jgi:ATP-binding cassette subfamily B (MDR/TAP) protein 1
MTSSPYQVLVSLTAIRTTKNLRVHFLQSVLRQEVGYFDSPAAGSITGQITTNGNLVNGGISEKLGLVIQAVSTFVTAFVVAFAVQWKLTLIIVCIVPTSLVVTMVTLAMDTKYEQEAMGLYAKAGLVAEEALSSIRNVHAFWTYEFMSKRYGAILEQAKLVGHKKSPVLAVLYSFEFFCIYAGYALAFWQGTRRYASGEIGEPGEVITWVQIASLLLDAMY